MFRRPVGLVADMLNWPRRAVLWHRFSLVTVGAALGDTIDTAQQDNIHSSQSPGEANGDTFTNGFLLRPGNYTFKVTGITSSSLGIIDWYIDDALAIAGQDWYTASLTYNVAKTGSVQIKGLSPYHTLKGVVNGKNASSTSYRIILTVMTFYPSAD